MEGVSGKALVRSRRCPGVASGTGWSQAQSCVRPLPTCSEGQLPLQPPGHCAPREWWRPQTTTREVPRVLHTSAAPVRSADTHLTPLPLRAPCWESEGLPSRKRLCTVRSQWPSHVSACWAEGCASPQPSHRQALGSTPSPPPQSLGHTTWTVGTPVVSTLADLSTRPWAGVLGRRGGWRGHRLVPEP